MARLDCFKGPDVSRMTHEWERDTRPDGSWAFKPSSKIDPARTPLNYSMESGRADARLARRLSDPGLKVDARRHVNKAGVWVVTCPQELVGDPDAVRRFFELVYDFTKERYGAGNVLQGYVHMDETTPHIHMPVVPVRDGRVSAKAVFNRRELPAYQRDLDKAVGREPPDGFGRKGLMFNGRTKGGYTTAELRERTAREAEVRRKEFAAGVKATMADAKADNAEREAARILAEARETASRTLQEAQERGERDAEGIRASASQEAATALQEARREAQAIRGAARTAVVARQVISDAVGVGVARRRKRDREARQAQEAELARREADVARREAEVADQVAALDYINRQRVQRRAEALRRDREARADGRAMDGDRLLDGMEASLPGVPGHGPQGRER